MAIAGRVAIVPKGEYSNAVTYDKLDLVMFNNDAYIAKKASTGIEPTNDEYWMLILNNVVAEDLEKIINGATPVGNANKLGGKDASEYVDVFEFVEDANSITKSGFYKCTQNLPFDYALANVIMVGDTSNTSNIPTQIAFGIDLNPTTRDLIAVRSYDGSNWTEWTRVAKTADLANYMPKSGGQINSPDILPIRLNTTASGATEVRLPFMINGALQGYLAFDGVNSPVFISNDGVNRPLIHSGNVGSYALPLSYTGQKTVSSDQYSPLRIANSIADAVMLNFAPNGTDVGSIGVSSNGDAFYQRVGVGTHTLLHTGNKPSGSYTGNGSATTRTINVGGNGKFLMVKGSDLTMYLVSNAGCYSMKDGGGNHTTMATFSESGNLNVTGSTSSVPNVSGVIYEYEVV